MKTMPHEINYHLSIFTFPYQCFFYLLCCLIYIQISNYFILPTFTSTFIPFLLYSSKNIHNKCILRRNTKKYLHYVCLLLHGILQSYRNVKNVICFFISKCYEQMEKGCKKSISVLRQEYERKDEVWINNNKCFIAFCL